MADGKSNCIGERLMENRFLKYIRNMTRSTYDIFMEEYKDKHKYCPRCGSDSYIQTLVAYIFDANNPDSYENRNQAMCKCGFKHTINDRLPSPPT